MLEKRRLLEAFVDHTDALTAYQDWKRVQDTEFESSYLQQRTLSAAINLIIRNTAITQPGSEPSIVLISAYAPMLVVGKKAARVGVHFCDDLESVIGTIRDVT